MIERFEFKLGVLHEFTFDMVKEQRMVLPVYF